MVNTTHPAIHRRTWLYILSLCHLDFHLYAHTCNHINISVWQWGYDQTREGGGRTCCSRLGERLFNVQSTIPALNTQSYAASGAASAATQRYGRFRLQGSPNQWMPNLPIFLSRVLSNRQPPSASMTIDELGSHDSTCTRACSLMTRCAWCFILQSVFGCEPFLT